MRRSAWLVAALGVALWLLFFDSHSIYRRVMWGREAATLRAENAVLERDIEELKIRIKEADGNEVIEQIAREEYGMRRPGEVVYRVSPAD